MKEMKCRDVGQNCNFICRGETEEEVLKKAAEHGKKSHGMTELSEELKNKIKNSIKDAKAA
jgi:predicted small metal-binding protein